MYLKTQTPFILNLKLKRSTHIIKILTLNPNLETSKIAP
jgi:hypothetical protein